MEYKYIYPSSMGTNTALSLCFSKKELLSAGVDNNAIDFDSNYLGKTEFTKIFNLWKDPLYLVDFYNANKLFFQEPFWQGITCVDFVREVVQRSQGVFHEIEKLLKEGNLSKKFESLDCIEDNKRKSNRIFKVKAKYGYISGHMAFRIYGVLINRQIICITGGTIKIVQKMEDASNTAIELQKMKLVSDNLNINDVFDKDSFIEFITE